MRDTFIKTLTAMAAEDEDIFLLTADLGFKIFDEFREKHGKRFINLGVAEANMIGVGAGLALSGKNVYCYSIAPFLVMRPFEQIRVDVCYHNLPVTLVGSGGGITYSMEGITHHAIEDIAVLRALPNMTVVCPGDRHEVEAIARLSARHEGPMYIRLPKTSPEAYDCAPKLEIGKAERVREGSDTVIITTGNMLGNSVKAAEKLSQQGVETGVVSMHTVKPLDTNTIRKIMDETKNIFVAEEHSRIGGLGSAIADIIATNGYNGKYGIISLPDSYCKSIGSHECLRQKYQLNPEQIKKTILKEYRQK